MNKILILLALISQTINLFAQPGGKNALINQSAYSQSFLHCVSDEKYFAKYAMEAQTNSFELMELIKCKLHIPRGINKIWQDAKSSNVHKKWEYDYSKDFWVGIRFNFYVGGVLVSTAFEEFEKPQKHDRSFTYYFVLDPLNFEKSEGDINYAYVELLKKIKNKGSQLVIEAALPSKNLNHKSYIPIVSSSFYLRYDTTKYAEWMKLLSKSNNLASEQLAETELSEKNTNTKNYNIQLKHLADSTMKSIFGENGFSKNFTVSCFQNPCEKGYLYANTFESNKPCSAEAQDRCKEAIITYSFIRKDVPLTVKMLITIKENGNFVNIENNPYGKNRITIEKQNLLSISEIQKIIRKKFPKDSLEVLSYGKALVYSNTRIKQPVFKDDGNKLNRDPGYRLIKETKAGEIWENGFIYIVRSNDPKILNRVYHFNAVTGELLWITEFYNVTD
jgi:hypothetical protein